MIPHFRQAFNSQFSQEKYQTFLQDIYTRFNHQPAFRIAETPVFIPNDFKHRLFDACNEVSNTLIRPDFMQITQPSIETNVPNEPDHALFVQMDFGICYDENGNLVPKLIEVQGFPSLYFFQDLLADAYRQHYHIPRNWSPFFGNYDRESYIELMRHHIVGNANPKNVILLELEPTKQTTQIDFWATDAILGTKTLCLSDLKKDGKDLYYLDDNGNKVEVHRIYHRVIFDELAQKPHLKGEFDFQDEINAEWVGHPNWFFRISKFTMPLFEGQYVPKSLFLNELEKYPTDLENYVLKPLYSFAGMGVKFHVTQQDLDEIKNPQHYILQEKVHYAHCIETPTDPVKCELRMLTLWTDKNEKPVLVNNLARLSRGEMIGVRFNKDKDWVGGSVAFFEKE